MKIQDCEVDMLVISCGIKGIIIGFDKNPIDEIVAIVQWFNGKQYQSTSLCHPGNFERYTK